MHILIQLFLLRTCKRRPSLQTFANLGEFLGGLAVIVSLAYLALQVRQNTQSVRTENYARALDRIASMQSQHRYDAADFGLTKDAIRQRFTDYRARHDLA